MFEDNFDAFDDFDDSALLDLDMDKLQKQDKENEKNSNNTTTTLKNTNKLATPRQNHQNYYTDNDVFDALENYFGFSTFRKGQKEVVRALLEGRDASVLWSTGAGKSLCYILPAMITRKISIVVSPLISLMQDQVNNFNNTIGCVDFFTGKGFSPKACFLGSAVCAGIEEDFFKGTYTICFVTPEKIAASSFLQRLRGSVCNGHLDVGLFAIDESHCVSEWGHDFRKSYGNLHVIRENFPTIPIGAFTATATKRTFEDISNSLMLKNPLIHKKELKRTNLKINVRTRKTDYDIFEELYPEIENQSTIVYVSTVKRVYAISEVIKNILRANNSTQQCEVYHGQLSSAEREVSHLNFLSGRSKLIVATVAFGMGIDKPDIRNVIHVGPPKTTEDYFQQIGRAGRDGLLSSCFLYTTRSDFNKFKEDFYLKELSTEQKRVRLYSLDSLMEMVYEPSICRQISLVNYFFKDDNVVNAVTCDRCNICDNCVSVRENVGDLTRDFTEISQVIFFVFKELASMPLGKLTQLCTTGSTSKLSTDELRVQQKVKLMKESLSNQKHVNANLIKELIPLLCKEGYLATVSKTIERPGGYQISYELCSLTSKGRNVTNKIVLPVPSSLRKVEKEAQAKIDKKLKELVDAAVDISELPANELNCASGPAVTAHLDWSRMLQGYESRGKPERAEKLKEMLCRITDWRSKTAYELNMAPSNVIPAFMCKKIAYSRPTSIEGLTALGIRVSGVRALAEIIKQANEELGLEVALVRNSQSDKLEDKPIKLPKGIFKPQQKWKHAVQSTRGKAKPAWEQYYDLWYGCKKPIDAIAVTGLKGKAVTQGTVVRNCLIALSHGLPVDFDRLLPFITLPTYKEYKTIEEMDSTLDYGAGDPRFEKKALICKILGPDVELDYQLKTEEQKNLEAKWYGLVDVFSTIKRANIPITFADEVGLESKNKRFCP